MTLMPVVQVQYKYSVCACVLVRARVCVCVLVCVCTDGVRSHSSRSVLIVDFIRTYNVAAMSVLCSLEIRS